MKIKDTPPPKAVIFDIDGTLADITHRLHHVQDYEDTHENRTKKDWDAFNAECHDDDLKWDIYRLLCMYQRDNYQIILISGRNENIRQKTIDWLDKHNVPWHTLHMRGEKDYRSDWEIKEEILMNDILPNFDVHIVIDDRDQVVEMWRRNGLTCLQCQKGDY